MERRRLSAVNALRQHKVFSKVGMALVKDHGCRPLTTGFSLARHLAESVGLDNGRFGVDLLAGACPTRVLAGARLQSHHANGGQLQVLLSRCGNGLAGSGLDTVGKRALGLGRADKEQPQVWLSSLLRR